MNRLWKSWRRCAASKRRRQPAGKSPSRALFRAAGWEPLERRMLLTSPGTITWTGGSALSSNWSDAANWNLSRAPITGDSLVFPASAQRLTNNDDISGLAVSSITFQGTFTAVTGGYTIGGSSLTVGSGGVADNGSIGVPTASILNQIDLNVVLGGSQNWSINDTNNLHHLAVNGNVANGGFTLTAAGTGIVDISGRISGSGGLSVNASAGTSLVLDLTGSDTYTGATQVLRGALVVNGSTAAASAVTVNPTATLGGAGTVGGPITVLGANSLLAGPGGILDPGAGPNSSADTGTLSNTGGVTFKLPSPPAGVSLLPALAVQLGGTAATPTNDRLDSAGTVSFTAATLNLTTLPGTTPFNAGQEFVIVQAGAPITTTFGNLPEGGTVSDGIQNFTISYAGNRVTLTAQPTFTYLNGQTGDSTAATFVQNLYRELLGREPDTDGDSYWTSVFVQIENTSGAAAAQQALVGAFFGSNEYQQNLVQGMYVEFLRRPADVGGLGFWTGQLAAGVDEKIVLANLVGSDEYFADAGGTVPGWVNAMYVDLLGRPADAGGLAYWTSVTEGPPAMARSTVAFEFLSNSEANQKVLNGDYPAPPGSVGAPGTPALGAYGLADITGNGWDNLYFQGNLSPAAVDSLFNGLQAGVSYNATIASMLRMAQYLDG
jgi:autotransporter-associated beta strand protein